MTIQRERARPDPVGVALLLATVVGWGLNWPAMKLLMEELPPLTIRWTGGVLGFALLAVIALRLRESLAVPRALWPRLMLASLLNVTGWMGLASLSLLWLAASEATIICYTVPLWAALFGWALLGERPGWRRVAAILMGLTGVAVLVLGKGVEAGLDKLPGVGVALGAALTFALGTVVTKRWPMALPPTASAAWQTALGCLPLLLVALALERPDPSGVSAGGWALLAYGGIAPLGLCYLAWFAALRRLPAAAAASGTLLVPVVGVAGAIVFLGEPFGLREGLALALTVGGVVLAIRG